MLNSNFRRVWSMLLLLSLPCNQAPAATAWRLQQEQELAVSAPALRAVVKSRVLQLNTYRFAPNVESPP